MDELTSAGEAFTEIVAEIFRLNGLVIAAGDRLTAPVGQSSARWQVLAVASDGPASVAQVARTMGLTRQSVQRTADLLAKDGLVEYTENPHHRRAKLMTVTPKAREVLDYIREQQISQSNRIGEQHDSNQLRAAVEILREIREDLEKEKQDGDSLVDPDF